MRRGRRAIPKLVAVLANKVARLVMRLRLATDLGPDAVLLLLFVVMTEDATRYRKAVGFYSEDLARSLGVSLATLKRCRERLVRGGWLVYTPGARNRPARYFVTVSTEAQGLLHGAGCAESVESDGGPILGHGEPESPGDGEEPVAISAHGEPETGEGEDMPAHGEPVSEGGGSILAQKRTSCEPPSSYLPERQTDRPAGEAGQSVNLSAEGFDPLKGEAEAKRLFVQRWNAAGLKHLDG